MAPSATILLLALAPAASPDASAVALLTSVGDADEDVKRAVDAALRKAINTEPGFDLLSSVETREQVSSLAEMGLICLPEDVPCFVKLGLAASVKLVLVPVVGRGGGGKAQVDISVVDVPASKLARSVSGPLAPDDDGAVRELARRALGLAALPDEKPAEGEGEDGGEGEGEGDKGGEGEGEGDLPPAEAAPGPPVGLILAGVGGAAAGLSVVGAVVCDLIYADVIDVADARTRRDVVQPAGAVLWISSAVALVVLGSGVAMTLTAAPADGEP